MCPEVYIGNHLVKFLHIQPGHANDACFSKIKNVPLLGTFKTFRFFRSYLAIVGQISFKFGLVRFFSVQIMTLLSKSIRIAIQAKSNQFCLQKIYVQLFFSSYIPINGCDTEMMSAFVHFAKCQICLFCLKENYTSEFIYISETASRFLAWWIPITPA